MNEVKFDRKRDIYKNRYGYMLVAPALICIFLLSIYPLARGVWISFLNYDMTRATSKSFGTFAGFSNYAKIFSSEIFRHSTWTTVIWTVSNIVFQVIFALIIALVLNEKFIGRSFSRTVAMIPWAIPSAVSALVFSSLVDTNVGILNVLLIKLGVLDSPIAWLGDVRTALPTVIVANIWKSVPFLMIFILAALQGVSPELYESASIDGAGKIRRFFSITMPCIKEPMAVAVVLNIISTLNNFNAIWLMTQGGPLYQTEIMYTYAYRVAFVEHKFGYSAAASTIIFLIIAVLTTIYIKMITEDNTAKKKKKR